MGIAYAMVSPNLIPLTCFLIMRQLYLTPPVRWCTRILSSLCILFLYSLCVLFLYSLWWLARHWYNLPLSMFVVFIVTTIMISICADLLHKETSGVYRETIRGLLSHRLDKDNHKLEPGDHIYSWRNWYTYAHHGIYGRDEKVIHLTRGEGHIFGLNRVLLHIGRILFSIRARILINLTRGDTSSSHLTDNPTNPCSTCGNQSNQGGVCVISSCMKCFLSGGDLYLFHYNVSVAFFLAKLRGGTCTRAPSDPPEEVLNRAESLLRVNRKTGFAVYDLFQNNCEDFAIYCKTGPRVYHKIVHPDIYHNAGTPVRRTMRVNSSGQVAFLPDFVVASLIAVVATATGVAATATGVALSHVICVFCFTLLLVFCERRLESDVQNRLESDRRFLRKRFVFSSASEE